MPKVTIIQPTKPDDSGKIRAAAYCRVSTNTADQHHSYTMQMEYYTRLFENSTTELLVGIYADEGISGTGSENRSDFQRMLRDCRKGKIDRIYTKSISRFSRNTKDCLQSIRELRTLGVSVYFEKENIDTGTIPDEMLFTILGGLAQEESISLSKNIRWSLRKKMKNGTLQKANIPIGYLKIDGKIAVDPERAAVVRRIFEMAYSGNGSHTIAKVLNLENIPSPDRKSRWYPEVVVRILRSEWYIGDLLFQKTFMTDTLPHRQKLNHGEYDQYYMENMHEPIVSREMFGKVQELLAHRSRQKTDGTYTFSGKIQCAKCGCSYLRSDRKTFPAWVCRRHRRNAADCDNGIIREEVFENAFTALHNKLLWHYTKILVPAQQMLHSVKIKAFSGNSRVLEIQNEIAALREQNHVLAALRTKGFLSDGKYQAQSAELQTKISRRKRELSRLTRSDEEDEALEQIGQLIRYFENRQNRMDTFEEDVFNEIVGKIIVIDEHTLEFRMSGGFHFTEHTET